MHIVVCIKQVPDSAQIRVHPVTNTIMRQGVPTIINPYDLFALEEALRLRDRFGGTVTVLTMGPPMAEDSPAQGDDVSAPIARVLLTDRFFAGSDTLATSFALSQAIGKIGETWGVPRNRVHRQADHRRRHRAGGSRHRQAPGPQSADLCVGIETVDPDGRHDQRCASRRRRRAGTVDQAARADHDAGRQ